MSTTHPTPGHDAAAQTHPMNHAADVIDALQTRLESFADAFARCAQTADQEALAASFTAFVADEARTMTLLDPDGNQFRICSPLTA